MAARFPEDSTENVTSSPGYDTESDRDDFLRMLEDNKTDPEAGNYTTNESQNPNIIIKQVKWKSGPRYLGIYTGQKKKLSVPKQAK